MPLIQVTIIYWMANLNPSAAQFFWACLIYVLVANSAVTFGQFLSSMAPNAEIANGLSCKQFQFILKLNQFNLN
jgi:hypothetical protein